MDFENAAAGLPKGGALALLAILASSLLAVITVWLMWGAAWGYIVGVVLITSGLVLTVLTRLSLTTDEFREVLVWYRSKHRSNDSGPNDRTVICFTLANGMIIVGLLLILGVWALKIFIKH